MKLQEKPDIFRSLSEEELKTIKQISKETIDAAILEGVQQRERVRNIIMPGSIQGRIFYR